MPSASQAGNDLLSHLIGDIARTELLAGVRHVIVGCSGGCDSVVLLDLITRVAVSEHISVSVAHLDHGLRADSAVDARFVQRIAAARRLAVVAEKAGPAPVTGSIEQWARRTRLDFFARLAGAQTAAAVAVGHTLDDQAETVLMRLARGAGGAGLAGMSPRVRHGGLLLVRPLLGVRRAAVRRYAEAHDIDWREDPSNQDLHFTRNRFRHAVVPEIEAAVPGAIGSIARAAELGRDEEDWLDGLVNGELDRLRLEPAGSTAITLDARALRRLHPALARRLVREALRQVRGDLLGIDRSHIDAVIDQVAGGNESARDLPGVRARLEGALVRLEPLRGRRPVASQPRSIRA